MFIKAKEKKLYEDVVCQIRNLIETGQLREGDLLPSEEGLSKNIGVSRATIREGLRILGLMGFVDTRPPNGTFVRTTGQEHFRAKLAEILQQNGKDSYYVHEIDRLLEPGIARLAAEKADESDIQKLKSALDKMEKALADGESGEIESLYFHRCIIDILQNPLLTAIYELTKEVHEQGRIIMAAMPGRPRQTLKEHNKIYGAISKGDGDSAYRYMDEHLKSVGKANDKFFVMLEKEKG